MDRINIIIADDHPVVREGLSSMLGREPDFNIVGEARNGLEAIDMAINLHPDVMLIDLRMPEVDGVEVMRKIRSLNPDIKFVILTTYDNDDYIFKGIEAGAQAYLLKDTPREEIFNSIRAVSRGETIINPSVATKVIDQYRSLSRQVHEVGPFSSRELEILKLTAKGLATKDMASELSISEGTVKTHTHNIFQKLGVNNRMAAVYEATKLGYLKPQE
ncbi:MAG: response regulator transcription factor [Dehalococcoidales bacterium]|nr:response regulator transcription factor [Dehalococcoidales bacterium]